MNISNMKFCINGNFCKILLSELRTIETKCDQITIEVSEVKRLIASLPPEIGILLNSLERSANEMHEQSVAHREYVEKCINGGQVLHLVRRDDHGL